MIICKNIPLVYHVIFKLINTFSADPFGYAYGSASGYSLDDIIDIIF
jgi:hypothetical protein